MDWSGLYPAGGGGGGGGGGEVVEFADVGCGYGGLLVQLSPMFPATRILGMEIRVKVFKILSLAIYLRTFFPSYFRTVGTGTHTGTIASKPTVFKWFQWSV